MDLSLADIITKSKMASKQGKPKQRKASGGKVARRERSGKALRSAPYKRDDNNNKRGSKRGAKTKDKKLGQQKVRQRQGDDRRGGGRQGRGRQGGGRQGGGRQGGGRQGGQSPRNGRGLVKVSLENLVDGVEKEDIQEIFSTVADIHRCVVFEGGCGFVLVHPKDAHLIVSEFHNRELDGQLMRVVRVQNRGGNNGFGGNYQPPHQRDRGGKSDQHRQKVMSSRSDGGGVIEGAGRGWQGGQGGHYLDRSFRKHHW